MRLSSILAYIDEGPESATALRFAKAMANRSKASITVMDVLEGTADIAHWPESEDLDALRRILIDSRSERLGIQAKRQRITPASVVVRIGKTSVQIVRQVLLMDHDVVIKTARGRADGRRVTFGTTAMHLVRKCPKPVMLVLPGASSAPKRVLAAINPVGPGRLELAGKVLDHAAAMASLFDAELSVLHCWDTQADLISSSEVTPDAIARHVEATHRGVNVALGTVLQADKHGIPEDRRYLVLGSAIEGVVRAVREKDIDLLVMASVGNSIREGQLIGSTAEEVLSRVDCSVLSVKPDEFVSPIRLN